MAEQTTSLDARASYAAIIPPLPAELTPKSFRPWPKKIDGFNREVLDREKIKEQYLSGPIYDFKEWCELWHYDYIGVRKNSQLPIRSWKEQWIKQRAEDQDDATIRQAIELRPKLLERSLEYIKQSGWTADTLRSVFNYHLSLIAADIRHDQENAEAIARGTVKAKYDRNDQAMQLLANAGEKVDKLMRSSLLLPNEKLREAVMNLPEIKQEERSAEAEGEELRSMPTQVIGFEGLSTAEMLKAMAGYYDQLQVPAPEPTQSAALTEEVDPTPQGEDESVS